MKLSINWGEITIEMHSPKQKNKYDLFKALILTAAKHLNRTKGGRERLRDIRAVLACWAVDHAEEVEKV